MLPSEIEQLFDHLRSQYAEEHRRTFESFRGALNRGEVRPAEPDGASKNVNACNQRGEEVSSYRLESIRSLRLQCFAKTAFRQKDLLITQNRTPFHGTARLAERNHLAAIPFIPAFSFRCGSNSERYVELRPYNRRPLVR